MKILYYDLFCGISGDMNMGALVDLGVDFEALKEELKKLKIDEEFDLVMTRGMKHGISGSKVDVVLYNQEGHEEDHNHHGHHHHEKPQAKVHHHHHHDHRNFATIREMIENSDLSDRVKTLSVEIFRLIAVAEGKVHNKAMEEVHFHEVGATDSIVDIVGATICLEALNVDKVMASSVQVGGGFVKCAHGKMPVPAPATAEILAGVPLNYNLVPFETTTPTGAAILKATVSEFTDHKSFTITRVGYGLGNKDFDIPNMTRVYLGEIDEATNDLVVEQQYLMECNIDDMSGERYTYVEKVLFEAGALDVFKTPIIMKKGRPATMLSLIFKDEDRHVLQSIVLKETTTAGLRERAITKYMMQRDFQLIETKYGEVKVKHLYLKGERVKSKPEYEDCARLAEVNGLSIGDIYKEVEKQLNQ